MHQLVRCFLTFSFSFLVACSGRAEAEVVPISSIQGKGTTSPRASQNEQVTIEAVVTAVFPGLGGCFVQEERDDGDRTEETSEGLFIHAPRAQLKVGDLARVTGRVVEYGRGRGTETRLVDAVVDRVDSSRDFRDALPPPVTVTLPLPSVGALESFEGMQVTFGEPLYVNDTYNLGRSGQVMLSGQATLRSPTAVVTPGKPATDKQLANRLNQILLDDGDATPLSKREAPQVPYLNRGGPVTLRRGSIVTELRGVLTHGPGSTYRVHPTSPPKIEYTERPAPPKVRGDLIVASMNVLNYFTTIDDGENGARGADSEEERGRQKAKIVSAIQAVDADICGLAELETGGRALQDLASALPTYSAIPMPSNFDEAPGADYPVQVGIIYQPEAVTPVGEAVVLSDPVFSESRPPLGQAFRHNESGQVVTVVVCHLKSKGRAPASRNDPNADQGDGQGGWNAARTAGARSLINFSKELQRSSSSPHVLVMGDFNAYQMEDPIRVLREGGLETLVGGDSYVYYGASGALDYIFGTQSTVPLVAGAATWAANSAEPRALDYNDGVREHDGDSREPINPESSLYTKGPYRSSDHDIPVVGLNLND